MVFNSAVARLCPNRDSLKKVAAAAEELGFDSLLIGDHIVIPKQITAPWPYDEYVGGKTPYAVYTEMVWLDPFDTMAFLAAITERVRLGISVVIVPYRHPFDVARRVATIDVLSGGRFIMGIGVGWLEDEFRLLNIPFKERGARTRRIYCHDAGLVDAGLAPFFRQIRRVAGRRQRPAPSPPKAPSSHLGWGRIQAGVTARGRFRQWLALWPGPARADSRPAGSNQRSYGRRRSRF